MKPAADDTANERKPAADLAHGEAATSNEEGWLPLQDAVTKEIPGRVTRDLAAVREPLTS
jgi:hypothetical protein